MVIKGKILLKVRTPWRQQINESCKSSGPGKTQWNNMSGRNQIKIQNMLVGWKGLDDQQTPRMSLNSTLFPWPSLSPQLSCMVMVKLCKQGGIKTLAMSGGCLGFLHSDSRISFKHVNMSGTMQIMSDNVQRWKFEINLNFADWCVNIGDSCEMQGGNNRLS